MRTCATRSLVHEEARNPGINKMSVCRKERNPGINNKETAEELLSSIIQSNTRCKKLLTAYTGTVRTTPEAIFISYLFSHFLSLACRSVLARSLACACVLFRLYYD